MRSRRDLASAWQLRGDVLRERGELDDSLGCYHRALGHQENSLDAQLAIADIYQMQRRPQRALATLEAAADRYVSQVPAEICWRQGIAQKALGRYEDAVKSFLAGRTAPDTRQLAFELGEA